MMNNLYYYTTTTYYFFYIIIHHHHRRFTWTSKRSPRSSRFTTLSALAKNLIHVLAIMKQAMCVCRREFGLCLLRGSHGQKPSFGAALGSQKVIVETGKQKVLGFMKLRVQQQGHLYSLGNRIVSGIMDGFNATVFMYGQTGSGKRTQSARRTIRVSSS